MYRAEGGLRYFATAWSFLGWQQVHGFHLPSSVPVRLPLHGRKYGCEAGQRAFVFDVVQRGLPGTFV
jgi:hypothetical protein